MYRLTDCDAADADLLHGVMQLSNLVDMDLSGNQIPEELQKHLTVKPQLTEVSLGYFFGLHLINS